MSAPILLVHGVGPVHTHHVYAIPNGSLHFDPHMRYTTVRQYVYPCLLESLDPSTSWRWGIYNPRTSRLQPFETYDCALVALQLGCVP